MNQFNRHIPYYYQIKEDILQRIQRGTWPPGSKLPSEMELAEQYGVSRPTVRQALAELTQEGYLIREKGRGTFVSRPVIVDNAQVFTTFDDSELRHIVNHIRLIHQRVIVPPPLVAHELDLSPDERVYEITTVRGSEHEKLAVRTSFIPEQRAPGLLEHLAAVPTVDVYQVLQQRYGLVPVGAEQIFQAVPASDKDASLLAIRRGTPVMLWQGLIYAAGGIKLARVRTIFRGDRFSFTVRQGRDMPLSAEPPGSVGIGILDVINGRIW
jgi:GntR family transcriptional regulator